jgi:hypothetical protein
MNDKRIAEIEQELQSLPQARALDPSDGWEQLVRRKEQTLRAMELQRELRELLAGKDR